MAQKIVLGIKFDEGTFTVEESREHKYRNFIIFKNGIKYLILFKSNKIYHAYFKNLELVSRNLNGDNWIIRQSPFEIIVSFINGALSLNVDNEVYKIDDNSPNIPNLYELEKIESEKINSVYNELITKYSNLYQQIKNKDKFKHEMIEYLSKSHLDEDDLDTNDSYNELDDMNYKIEVIDECKELFERFINSEKDNEKINSIVTLDNLIQSNEQLRMIDKSILKNAFSGWLNKNDLDKLIEKDYIHYDREDLFLLISNKLIEISEEYQWNIIRNKLSNDINDMVLNLTISNEDAEFINNEIDRTYNRQHIPTELEINDLIQKVIKDSKKWKEKYNHYRELNNGKEIIVAMNPTKKKRFDLYENGTGYLSNEEIFEFETVYKNIKNDLHECMYKKSSNKFKPFVIKFNRFSEYVDNIFSYMKSKKIIVEDELGNYKITNPESFEELDFFIKSLKI
ncbi:MAG: hypothetical protein E7191_05460 [Erysipelotrichaceae bacterium]|nr:hypothetical protein [Erysipelotrichaceae bacterium]